MIHSKLRGGRLGEFRLTPGSPMKQRFEGAGKSGPQHHQRDDKMPTTLEVAKQHEPGSRTVVIRYGKIPSYRGNRKSWGFEISDTTATDMYYGVYTCSRPNAKKLFETKLKPNAEERGFVVVLTVDKESELKKDLTQIPWGQRTY